MRLLDRIAQCREPFLASPRADAAVMTVSGPSNFAQQIVQCPLRFVLAEDLTRACGELAFAEGDSVAGCLDLLRLPASLLWVEWSDAIHQEVIHRCGAVAQADPNASGRQVGVLLRSAPDGRSGIARTFWSLSNNEGVLVSPVETHIGLDDCYDPVASARGIMQGHFISITDSRDAGVAELFQRVRYRFDPTWLEFYRAATSDISMQETIARRSLAAVASDIPFLLSFFLLLGAKGATRPVSVQRDKLNRKRLANKRPALLDHVEVHATLPGHLHDGRDSSSDGALTRRPPRLHHVRGHLVRRENRVFWRTPHVRGYAHQGLVRSRTVCLSFPVSA